MADSAEELIKDVATNAELLAGIAVAERYLALARGHASELPEATFLDRVLGNLGAREVAENALDNAEGFIAHIHGLAATAKPGDPADPRAITSARVAVRATQALLVTIQIGARDSGNIVIQFIREMSDTINAAIDEGGRTGRNAAEELGSVGKTGAEQAKGIAETLAQGVRAVFKQLWPVLAVVGGVAAVVGVGYVVVRVK